MKGKRVDVDTSGKDFNPESGDYGKDPNGQWYAKPPGFLGGYANLSKHEVTEHEDGTITVKPSILVKNNLNVWHGFLEKGEWRGA